MRRPNRPTGWVLFWMLAGFLIVTFIVAAVIRVVLADMLGDDIAVGVGVVLGMGAGFVVMMLIGKASGTRPAFVGDRPIGETLHDFATAPPSANKPTLQGLGWLALFFAGQVVIGGIVYITAASMAQAAVFEWRYASSMPFVVAALPTLFVVGLLEYLCAKIAGHGPITVILVFGFAILFSA